MQRANKEWLNDAIGLLLGAADDPEASGAAIEEIAKGQSVRDACLLLQACVLIVAGMVRESDAASDGEIPRVREMLVAQRDWLWRGRD